MADLFPQRLAQIFDQYGYLNEVNQRYPYTLNEWADGTLGQTTPTEKSINIELSRNLYKDNPIKAANVLAHEIGHAARMESPSWTSILSNQQNTPSLKLMEKLAGQYPVGEMVEESMMRKLAPSGTLDKERFGQTSQYLTGDQQAQLGHFTRYAKGGPDALWSGLVDQSTPPQPVQRGWEFRTDGTPKGPGFLGSLPRPDGSISTEISIGVNLDGKETLIPSLVPTLTPEEISYLQNGGDPRSDRQIVDKAVTFAKQRIANGRSPFFQEGENYGVDRDTEPGKAYRYQYNRYSK